MLGQNFSQTQHVDRICNQEQWATFDRRITAVNIGFQSRIAAVANTDCCITVKPFLAFHTFHIEQVVSIQLLPCVVVGTANHN